MAIDVSYAFCGQILRLDDIENNGPQGRKAEALPQLHLLGRLTKIGLQEGTTIEYVYDNPLILFDRYGLFSEFGYNALDWYSPSPPLDYRTLDILTPTYENRWSIGPGIVHGGFDYLYDQLECWESCCYGIGAGMMEFDHDEHQHISAAFGFQQQYRSEFFDASIQNLFSIDANDTVYQQTRSTTKLGLDVATIGAAGYSLAKAGVKAGSVAYRSLNSVKKANPFQRSLAAATESVDLTDLATTTTNVQTINPNLVRFCQDIICNKFRDGRCVYELVEALKTGVIKAHEIPPIRLFNRNNVLYTLDNRRLEAFRRAGVDIPYGMATPKEIRQMKRSKKFSTLNEGTSTEFRGE